MKKTHNLVAVTGTYKDNNGQEKKRYTIIGAAFTREDGSMALKLESVPVGGGWNGWVNLYVPRDKQEKGAQGDNQAPPPASETGGNDGEPFNDPIPFGD